MADNHSKDMDFSRRQFMQLMAGASLASVSGVLHGCSTKEAPTLPAQAKSTFKESTSKRTVPFPKIKVSIGTPAAERYQVRPDLKRFSDYH